MNQIPSVAEITYLNPSNGQETPPDKLYCRNALISLKESGALKITQKLVRAADEKFWGIFGLDDQDNLMDESVHLVIPPCKPYCECGLENKLTFGQAEIELF